jgi:hypothetical protein
VAEIRDSRIPISSLVITIYGWRLFSKLNIPVYHDIKSTPLVIKPSCGHWKGPGDKVIKG